jgi:hypothetical protein
MEFISTNRNNILFLGILILALLLHLFLGEIILDSEIIQSPGLLIGLVIVVLLVVLHFVTGKRLFHRGGKIQ